MIATFHVLKNDNVQKSLFVHNSNKYYNNPGIEKNLLQNLASHNSLTIGFPRMNLANTIENMFLESNTYGNNGC